MNIEMLYDLPNEMGSLIENVLISEVGSNTKVPNNINTMEFYFPIKGSDIGITLQYIRTVYHTNEKILYNSFDMERKSFRRCNITISRGYNKIPVYYLSYRMKNENEEYGEIFMPLKTSIQNLKNIDKKNKAFEDLTKDMLNQMLNTKYKCIEKDRNQFPKLFIQKPI